MPIVARVAAAMENAASRYQDFYTAETGRHYKMFSRSDKPYSAGPTFITPANQCTKFVNTTGGQLQIAS
jgi:hypothetical protein